MRKISPFVFLGAVSVTFAGTFAAADGTLSPASQITCGPNVSCANNAIDLVSGPTVDHLTVTGVEGVPNAAVYVPNGWVTSAHCQCGIGDGTDEDLDVIGTTDLEQVRFVNPFEPATCESCDPANAPWNVDVNDFNGNFAAVVRTSNMHVTPTADIDWTGIADGNDSGRLMCLYNESDDFYITLKHDDPRSLPGNRYDLPRNKDYLLGPRKNICLIHSASRDGGLHPDDRQDRWRVWNGLSADDVSSTLTPDPIAGLVNNWNPPQQRGAATIWLQTSGAVELTGLANGRDGRRVRICNAGAHKVTLYNENAWSAPNNWFLNPDGNNWPLGSKSCVSYEYQGGTVNRWRMTAWASSTFPKLTVGSLGITDSITAVRHIAGGGGAPVMSMCGNAASREASSTDLAGTFTTGDGATGCMLAFTATYLTPPHCTVTARHGANQMATDYTTTVGALVLTSAVANATYDYTCLQ